MKIKKSLSLILVLILLLVSFSGCREDDITAYYFTVPQTAGTFDPQICSDDTARFIVRNTFEGLVRMDADGNFSPAAAESYEISPDGLTYTFHINTDVKWHITSNAAEQLKDKLPEDFAPRVTAYDFYFGLMRTLNPDMNAPDAASFFAIRNAEDYHNGTVDESEVGIGVSDEATLVITLSYPRNDFLEILTLPAAMPCNETFFQATGGRYGLYIRYSLSNGPFYLSRFDETSYRLAKNPDYSGNYEAKADVIWLYSVTDEEALQGITEGTYDGGILNDNPVEDLGDGVYTASSTDTVYGFLLNEEKNTLSDIHVRKAFALAADYTVLAQNSGKTYSPSLLPECCGIKTGAAPLESNPTEALALLGEGLKEEELEQAEVTLLCEEAYEAALKQLLQTWQKNLGITFNITLKTVTRTKLEALVAAGDYDIALYPLKASMLSPYGTFRYFYSEETVTETPVTEEKEETVTYPLSDLIGIFSLEGSAFVTAVTETETAILNRYTFIPLWQQASSFVMKNLTGALKLPGNDNLYLSSIQ